MRPGGEEDGKATVDGYTALEAVVVGVCCRV
jgi:hypothetical protein